MAYSLSHKTSVPTTQYQINCSVTGALEYEQLAQSDYVATLRLETSF